jgi:uncharacterized membrane protein
MKRLLCGLVALELLVGGAGEAKSQPSYVYTTLDGVLAGGINDAGQVVGSYDYPEGGYLYSGGIYTPIKVPVPPSFPPGNTIVAGISNTGLIVGWYGGANGAHGFLRGPSGGYTNIDVPFTPLQTFPYGVNSASQIVGYYQSGTLSNLTFLGFLRSEGTYTTISVPGSTETTAFGINDRSQIVGSYFDRTFHGFVMNGSGYTTIDFPGAAITGVFGINNLGQLVGYYVDSYRPGDQAHGFLFSDGIYTTIDVPGAKFTDLTGINDAGQIVGYYGDASDNLHVFLATPIPEPSTLLLLAIGTLGVIGWVWRRRYGTKAV